MMIKSISLVCLKLGFIQKGWFSKNANYRGMEKYLVNEIFDHTNHKSWYPDDYISTSEKSTRVKDRDDTQLFHAHLKEIGFYEKIESLNSTVPL